MYKIAFSIKQAAENTGVGLSTIRSEINAGRLRAHRCGARVLITPDDLQDWLAALPPHQGSAAPDQEPGGTAS
jgi:excisionase family DNA binding protein